ncbi:DNA polymerase beta-like protein [Tothia fuscella]|uniref:DNA polymerase n=1 Tax=Tothia fuscella TaxID=1048955 RepID=A0A9P4NTP4_9PEZI|nr:DNA polymerase beta-like protein [Tothia fuscella]
MVPEAQRIFTGLSLYFFPNSDANKVRKRRIEKAKEYGAVWTKVWSNNVTHVIVDNKMTYQEVTKFLKLDTLPPEIIVVNETYLFDCISYHNLLDPKARYYEVPGMPTSSTVVEVAKLLPSELSSLNSSLPLKPAKNDIQILDTPSASVESGDVHQGQNDPAQDNLLSPANGTPNEPENISFGYNDELSAIMKESQSLKHIPVDLEDEDDTASLANSESDSDDDSKGNPSTKPKKSWQENFQCMDKHDGANTDANPNSETIEILQQMSEFYDRIRDQWRTLAYRKAIASLKKQSQRVIFQEDAVKLPFVGHRIAAKIEEIALTRGLRRLDNAKLDPHDQVLQMFMKIYGVGISQASQWVQQGYRTLKDLEKSAKLSTNQKIGIAHYDDLQLRIPRAEVEHHGAVVRDALRQMDPEFQVTVGGSYRRGALSSGDVDLIITRPGADARSLNISAIGTLVPKLESAGFLVAALAKTSKDTGSKWHGCSKLPTSDVWRRIDLLLVPWDEMGAALIYFTGNDIFNRSIRLLASKKGMRLNQRGLFKDVMRGPGRVKVTDGILLEGRNEKRIFEILGVPWRPPEHRIC